MQVLAGLCALAGGAGGTGFGSTGMFQVIMKFWWF
jgi:hypothetical protein